ncbi:uncharacterized protein LOC143238333 [Tachypleus tridentatus]|uniref:uncharacterized protein LOC143238333 n=1 Tax=Tachypleus tridentatus TaxID=6853 RepID=UPI003FCF93DB
MLNIFCSISVRSEKMKFIFCLTLLLASAVYILAQTSCQECGTGRMNSQQRLACCNLGINEEQCCSYFALPNIPGGGPYTGHGVYGPKPYIPGNPSNAGGFYPPYQPYGGR